MESWDRFDIFKELCAAIDRGDARMVRLRLDQLEDCVFDELIENELEE